MKGMTAVAQVELLVHTFYGKPLKPGDTIEVDRGVAERWERNRIARVIGDQSAEATDQTDGKNELPKTKTVAELKEIAEANGVNIAGLKKRKQIFDALQAAGVPV